MVTVYTFAQDNYQFLTGSTIVSFIIVAFGIALFRTKLSAIQEYKKPLFQIFGILLIVFPLLSVVFSYYKFVSLKSDFESGNYLTVKGKIHDFKEGATFDFFRVRNDGFIIHEDKVNLGYYIRCSSGGVLRPSRQVELGFIGNSIVTIKVNESEVVENCKV